MSMTIRADCTARHSIAYDICVTHAYDQRTARLLGAVSLAVADELRAAGRAVAPHGPSGPAALVALHGGLGGGTIEALDRKSTRLNSSHVAISYAVFCLKKK